MDKYFKQWVMVVLFIWTISGALAIDSIRETNAWLKDYTDGTCVLAKPKPVKSQ